LIATRTPEDCSSSYKLGIYPIVCAGQVDRSSMSVATWTPSATPLTVGRADGQQAGDLLWGIGFEVAFAAVLAGIHRTTVPQAGPEGPGATTGTEIK
jgi:hypothetical protein